MDFIEEPILLLITFPLLAGFVCLLLPKQLDRVRSLIALVSTAITMLLAWHVFAAVRQLEPKEYLVFWDEGWLNLCLDHLSGFVLLGTTVFGFLIALYSIGYMKGKERLREYYAYLLWTVGISCGAILANDLLLLLVFWGLLGLTLYVMIGIAGPDASSAAKKSFIIIGGSDCFLLLGVVIVWLLTGTTRIDGISLRFTGELTYVAFFCFAVAALAKAGAMPFHSWVPDCGEKAPVSVTAFLPASLDKLLGIYLLARVATSMFKMNIAMNTFLMVIGAGTVICAVMMALVQHDLKRLLSYHAVSQVGYMVLGIGTGTLVGIAGGLFHMLNNAIFKSSLFLCAGAVEKNAGTTDLDKLGGLARAMPLTFASCFVAALAISGVPPLNGFASKWMIYQGIIESGRGGGHLWVIWLAAAMLGSALTLASFVKVLHATFLCKPSAELKTKKIREVGASMWLPMVGLAVLCVLFGVFAYNLPLRNLIFPAVGGGVKFLGAWNAGLATVMLFAGYVIGLVIYFLTTARKARECETYIGGEIMTEIYISGEAISGSRNVEVTGVDFYQTIEDMVPFRGIYTAARRKLFDLYDVGTGVIFYFVEALRNAHTGRLPLYLTWFLAGFLMLLWLLTYGANIGASP